MYLHVSNAHIRVRVVISVAWDKQILWTCYQMFYSLLPTKHKGLTESKRQNSFHNTKALIWPAGCFNCTLKVELQQTLRFTHPSTSCTTQLRHDLVDVFTSRLNQLPCTTVDIFRIRYRYCCSLPNQCTTNESIAIPNTLQPSHWNFYYVAGKLNCLICPHLWR